MLIYFILASLAALGGCATSFRRDSPYVVHEKRDAPPRAWLRHRDASPEEPINLRIGLPQRNLEHGHRFIAEISDPSSPKYGQHWSPERIIDTFGPSDDAVQAVTDWLVSSGIKPSRIRPSPGRNWLKIDSTISEAQSLLQTKFGVYQHEDGGEHTACESYRVPAAIREHIDFIHPTIQFDSARHRRSVTKRDSIPHDDGNVVVAEGLDKCSEQIKPDCVRALYNFHEIIDYVPESTYGVMELAPQSYAQSDLDVFFEKVSSHVPSGTAPVVNKVNGGYFSNETGPAVLTESNLDLEYAMSLSYPQNVTVYQVGDSSREDRATNNNFLDAIDGTYCTYEGGDNTRWDAQYPHNSPVPMDGLYNGTNMCGTYNATSVITISYGRNENASPESYNERECHEYMKLGLMGVTVLFSSGDSGVAGFHGECLNEDGSHTERASKHGRFNPMFPASCPFVTSVGGTAIPENGTVYDKEIAAWEFQSGGGFSNQFLMPDYQQKAVQTYYQRTIATWFDSLCYGSSFQSLLPQYGASRYNNSKVVRGFPDVSMNGQYYLISVDGDFHPVSGTSASAPVLGALITVLNGLRIKQGKKTLGFLNHIFYQNPGIVNDIVEGNNPGCGTKGFDAVPGWDPVTGLGTVDYERMKEVVMKLP